jgi:hypothetical protein
MDANKLSIGVVKFVMEGWFGIKLGEGVLLLQRKIKEKGEMRGGDKVGSLIRS